MSYLDATADLLKVAALTLKAEVVPHLEADGRYPAAMVANALAIAARELEHGPRARAEERSLLAGLLEAPDVGLAELRRRLCVELRAGEPTAARAAELRDVLSRIVRARLAISNPAYGAAPADKGRPA